MTIKVVVADDHPIVRSGICNELRRHEDIEVVGEAVDGDEALRLGETLAPDVLLLDIHMPGLKAVRVVRKLQAQPRPTPVLVLSAYGDLENVLGMLEAGVTGYLSKEEDPATIAEGVRAVAQGKTWLSAAVTEKIVGRVVREERESVEERLTQRELEVLHLLARGWDNRDIGAALGITERTVRYHLCNVYNKLELNGRSSAIAWAVREGFGEE